MIHTQYMPELIIIHGLKYSGKTTIGDHFVDNYGYFRVKMADPLKNMLRSLMRDAGIDPDLIEQYIEGDKKEVPIPELAYRTSRQLMETLGDDWRKKQHVNFWSFIVESKIDLLHSQGIKVVVDDIRYDDEFMRFSLKNPMTIVTTRGNKHFEPVLPDTPASEIPMPISRFHKHFKNDYADKISLWREIDDFLAIYTGSCKDFFRQSLFAS